MDRFCKFLADKLVTARELPIAGERLLDAVRVATIERAVGVPWQQRFQLLAFAFVSLCSWPTSFDSLPP